MKKFLLLLFCLISFISGYAQDKQAIAKVLETQRQAWNRGDIDSFMKGYWQSDSLIFIGKTAPNYGYRTALENYKKHYPDKAAMGTLTFDIMKIKLLDASNAFVLGGWHLKRDKDAPGGVFTLWFKKINSVWVIVCDHTS